MAVGCDGPFVYAADHSPSSSSDSSLLFLLLLAMDADAFAASSPFSLRSSVDTCISKRLFGNQTWPVASILFVGGSLSCLTMVDLGYVFLEYCCGNARCPPAVRPGRIFPSPNDSPESTDLRLQARRDELPGPFSRSFVFARNRTARKLNFLGIRLERLAGIQRANPRSSRSFAVG